MSGDFLYSWQSPFDESDADLPVQDALLALDKFRNGQELTFDEDGLVKAAFTCRHDLVSAAGLEIEEVPNA